MADTVTDTETTFLTENLQSCAYLFGQPFFKDSEKTIYSAEKNDISYQPCLLWDEAIFEKKNSKWPTQKKSHFPAQPILNIFSWNLHGLVLGLVELIDAKGIDVAQLIWLWGCPT